MGSILSLELSFLHANASDDGETGTKPVAYVAVYKYLFDGW